MFTPSAFLSPIKSEPSTSTSASSVSRSAWTPPSALAGAVTTIALVPTREGVPTGVETGIRFLSEDAEGDHANLLARGVDADPEIMRFRGGVPPMFYFRDPDGNRLLIVERA